MLQQQPSVIIIAGTSGSGKSTIGAALSQRFAYAFFDGDDFHTEGNKAKMGRGESLDDEDRRPWLELLAAIWRDNPGKKMVIACSALKRKYREILLGGCPTRDQSKMVVLLKVPREVLKSRMDRRRQHFAKSNLIDSQLATMELPSQPGEEPNLLVVDGNLPVDEVVDGILKKLGFTNG